VKRILVTGAGGSAGINFVDSLRMAAEKMHIVGTDINKWHLELPDVDSRYILPRCPGKDYIDKLNRVIEKEKVEFIHPQPDVEVKVISENRERINALTYLPQGKTIEICQNKLKLNELLAKKDIPVPKSIPIKSAEDLKEAVNELKGRHRKIWLRAIRGAGARASLPIQAAEHGEMWIDYWEKTAGLSYGDFMACEFLPGKEFAFQSLWENGELITSAARERLEYIFGELTPSGQSSSPSVARVVRRDDVNEIATKAILAIDDRATGVFCIDLKENIEGIPCITEVNSGRFFTTSNFFASLGANMPYIYIKLAYKENMVELPKYNAVPDGCYWIRLMDKGPILIEEGTWRSRII
jgi:carbamoyl-phosphate synthase large subunit